MFIIKKKNREISRKIGRLEALNRRQLNVEGVYIQLCVEITVNRGFSCDVRRSCLVLVLVASLQWIYQQRCVRPATNGKTYTAGF